MKSLTRKQNIRRSFLRKSLFLFCWRLRRLDALAQLITQPLLRLLLYFCVWAQKRSLHAQNKTSIAYLILTWKGRYSLKIYVCASVCECAVCERRRKNEHGRQQSISDNDKFSVECYCLLFRRPHCDCVWDTEWEWVSSVQCVCDCVCIVYSLTRGGDSSVFDPSVPDRIFDNRQQR